MTSTVNVAAEDAGLAARIAGGDAAAEDELARRFRPRILSILRRRLADPSQAEDLAQEALRLTLIKLRCRALRHASSVFAYLCGVALRLAHHEGRAIRCHRQKAALLPRAWPDQRSDPEGRVVAREEAALLGSALRALRPRERAIVEAFYLGEMPKPQICSALGMSDSQFDVAKFRALRDLRRRLRTAGVTGHPTATSGPRRES